MQSVVRPNVNDQVQPWGCLLCPLCVCVCVCVWVCDPGSRCRGLAWPGCCPIFSLVLPGLTPSSAPLVQDLSSCRKPSPPELWEESGGFLHSSSSPPTRQTWQPSLPWREWSRLNMWEHLHARQHVNVHLSASQNSVFIYPRFMCCIYSLRSVDQSMNVTLAIQSCDLGGSTNERVV